MGEPRASRRRLVTISDDEDENASGDSPQYEPSEDERPAKRSTGKLQPTKKSAKERNSAPVKAPPNGSSKKSPLKSKVSASKGKTAAAERPKPSAKPIYSFFNAATQRLQSSQTPSASPEKRSISASQDEPEAIHDESEDGEGSGLQLAKSSSTALAVRKRKVHHEGSFENEAHLGLPASQKFRKASNGDRVPSFSMLNEDKRPWTEQFQPVDLSELAVHKRKVSDVRQWLEMTLNGQRQRVLVLKGAAGTGKTTTVRLLAQALSLDISEWKNPEGGDFALEGSTSTSLQFDDFIGRAGRSGGLQFSHSDEDVEDATRTQSSNGTVLSENIGQLLLIEEFPNTFSRTSSTLQSFRSAIMQYLASPIVRGGRPTPIVMVISETLLSTNTALADSFTSHRLLGPELSNHPFLDTIEFNAVAPTYLTKALETVVLKEARKTGRRRTPGPQVLKRLAESGDIRSAISSLEFLCLRGDAEDTWSSKVTFTKQKKAKTDPPLTKLEEEALKLISNRETTLDIFHAVGKVVYNKRVDAPSIPHPPPWLPQHRRNNVPENDVEILVDEVGTDTTTFLAALHENYALSCSSSSTEATLDSMFGCVASISDADLLSVDRFSHGTRAFSGSTTDSLRQDEMAFQVSVRGLWFSLPYPVHRTMPPDGKKGDAHRMFYPTSMRLWRKREEIESVLDAVLARLQAGDLAAGSQSKAGSAGSGVESWARLNSSRKTGAENDAMQDTSVQRTNSAKTEMLIERLPYVAQIMGAGAVSPRIVEQLNTVTRIRSSNSTHDDDGADDEEGEEVSQEQWTTDKPAPELGINTRSSKGKAKREQTKLNGSRSSSIPMESHVERLVLDDDDIVDD